MSLEAKLESYVSSIIDKYDSKKVDHKKIIRDAVLGTHELSPLEVNIIDTPFIQRLRGIHQTALACLTYPSATHTRFGHSLGVSIMASRIGKALGEKIDPTTLAEIRIAGLLHDIGHGPFSHASEDVIREFDDVKKTLTTDSRFSKEKPHEMISYKMLQTSAFKDFFEEKLLNVYKANEVSLKNISQMIIGFMPNRFEQYKADIINSAFDADKLDYLTRDPHFTGIRMSIDVDRILATQLIDNRRGRTQRIICEIGGVHILEQILFSKMLLFPSVYHHHKVRAAVCMLESIFELIKEEKLEINGLMFDQVSDFLSVDDNFFLTEKGKPDKVAQRIKKIKQKKLPKRALIISRRTLEEGSIEKLLEQRDRPQYLREIARAITEDNRLRNKCEHHDIWIDLPDPPRFPEPSQCIVKITEEHYETLEKFFPVAEWASSFATNKWRGFVFGPPDLQKTVDDVSREALESLFDIKLNEHATILAKHASYAS